jgi:transcriptional regulator with AAA-type ATPase domain
MEHFLRLYFPRAGRVPEIAAVRQAFLRHSVAGNVRELENA